MAQPLLVCLLLFASIDVRKLHPELKSGLLFSRYDPFVSIPGLLLWRARRLVLTGPFTGSLTGSFTTTFTGTFTGSLAASG